VVNIKQSKKHRSPFERLQAWVRRAVYGPPPVQVEIQWPMAQTSKTFEIQKFQQDQVELLIWMMYGAGFHHDGIQTLLENMVQSKMADQSEVEEAIDGTAAIKDTLNKAWSAAPKGVQ
jgi:Glu-tRNA(Gln) amidotransferase subunit E-like FAD-binding protein